MAAEDYILNGEWTETTEYMDQTDFDFAGPIRANEPLGHYAYCPCCGGDLVLKTGKFGKFYGCDNFPMCDFSCSVSRYVPPVTATVKKGNDMGKKEDKTLSAINRNLKFLELSRDFEVTKADDDNLEGGYKVSTKDSNLVAFMNDGKVEYTVSGVYNSGSDFAGIDIAALDRLRAFCEMLGKDAV